MHAFVVTHAVPREWAYEGSPFAFVTEGVESAVGLARILAAFRKLTSFASDAA